MVQDSSIKEPCVVYFVWRDIYNIILKDLKPSNYMQIIGIKKVTRNYSCLQNIIIIKKWR